MTEYILTYSILDNQYSVSSSSGSTYIIPRSTWFDMQNTFSDMRRDSASTFIDDGPRQYFYRPTVDYVRLAYEYMSQQGGIHEDSVMSLLTPVEREKRIAMNYAID